MFLERNYSRAGDLEEKGQNTEQDKRAMGGNKDLYSGKKLLKSSCHHPLDDLFSHLYQLV